METPTLTGLVDRNIRPALPDLLGDGYQSMEKTMATPNRVDVCRKKVIWQKRMERPAPRG